MGDLRFWLRRGFWSPCRLEVCAWLVQHFPVGSLFHLAAFSGRLGGRLKMRPSCRWRKAICFTMERKDGHLLDYVAWEEADTWTRKATATERESVGAWSPFSATFAVFKVILVIEC
jgi:hypothetical protein